MAYGGRMPDPQTLPSRPPAKDAKPTPENVRQLENWLNSVLAFRSGTVGRPWTFYEEMDRYLGPWGENGYPIAYGRKYCVLFSSDVRLQNSPAGAAWVRRTLILLQTALRDYVLKRFRDGTLGRISEAEFRRVAFDTHPKAYTEGGLAMLMLLDPNLVGHLATIPAAEFSPLADNFRPTLIQVFVTGEMLLPQAAGIILAGAAGPAHTGLISRAVASDQARFANEQSLGRALSELQRALPAGRIDHLGTLERIKRSISTMQWPNDGLARLAQDALSSIEARQSLVAKRYASEIAVDPSLRDVFRLFERSSL